MDDDHIRRINLLDHLEQEQPDVPPPPDDAAEAWTEAQIRGYYQKHVQDAAHVIALELDASSDATGTIDDAQAAAAGHADLNAAGGVSITVLEDERNADPEQPGGGRMQQQRPELDMANAPPSLRQNQLTANVAGYRAAAIAHGIPFRRHGLFPPRDPLLADLAGRPGSHPFEKHMAGAVSSYETLPHGGWTTGDAACRAGLDLRMFYQDPEAGAQHGTLVAAARLGEAASIGAGCWVSAHGGAVESLLDEATAETAKMTWAPTLATLEAAFKIKKAVPLNTTLRIACEIARTAGVRCWVTGSITNADGSAVYATCEAQLVDLAQLWAG